MGENIEIAEVIYMVDKAGDTKQLVVISKPTLRPSPSIENIETNHRTGSICLGWEPDNCLKEHRNRISNRHYCIRIGLGLDHPTSIQVRGVCYE